MVSIILLMLFIAIFVFAYIVNKQIIFIELVAVIIGLALVTLCMHGLSKIKFANSTYFESGRLLKVAYYPAFKERYTEYYQTCTTDSDGDSHCTTHSRTAYCKHREHWEVTDSFDRSWEVSLTFYNQVRKDFGSPDPIVWHTNRCTHGGRPVSGDPNTYITLNKTNTYNYPVSVQKHWHNPLIGTASLLNMKGSKSSIKYPTSDDMFVNNRYMPFDSDVTAKDWDIFNTKLYENIRANAILLHVDSIATCKDIEADWTNGGKNDVIVCVSGSYKNPDNVLVFGWSSDYLGMNKLAELILNKGITKATLPQVLEGTIGAYTPTDFTKFEYIQREHSIAFYFLLVIVLIVAAIYFYNSISTNEFTK